MSKNTFVVTIYRHKTTEHKNWTYDVKNKFVLNWLIITLSYKAGRKRGEYIEKSRIIKIHPTTTRE